MRVVLQRVKNARVTVDDEVVSTISKGCLLLVGISKDDDLEAITKMAEKIKKLRIFEDTSGKMNIDIRDAGGEILSVSQFTLLGNTKKGNRPGFDGAALPEKAKKLWQSFNNMIESEGITLKKGVFGAKMDVELINDGPVTFVLET